jgi:BirA family biotin operon repressor/biotin-[acetyl-CoA-carboxylase] ligase
MAPESPFRLEISTHPELEPWRVEWHAELDSTMERAAELARSGEPEGLVVVADFQRAGRGTHGRSWIAPRGTCLMFTFLLRPGIPPCELSGFPNRIAALAASRLSSETGLEIDVKPPNDLVVNGRKIAGILCTSHVIADEARWVACGIGLNTALARPDPDIPNATSLLLEGVPLRSHSDLLKCLLSCFHELRYRR